MQNSQFTIHNSQFFLCSHILIIVGWGGSHKGRPDNDDTL